MYNIIRVTDPKNWISLESEWDTLLEKCPDSSTFLTYTWLKTWWDTFSNNELFIILIYNDNKLEFIAPLYKVIENSLKKIKFISSKDSDYLNFIIDPNCNINKVVNLFIKYLKKYKDWNIADFHNIPESSFFYKDIEQIFKKKFFITCPKIQNKCYYINNFDNKKNLIDNFSKTFLKRVKKTSKKLGDYEFVNINENIDEVLETFFKLHKKRWTTKTSLSRFENKYDRDYFTKITKELFKQNKMIFAGLKKDGKFIAFHWNIISSNKIYCYIHIFDSDYVKLSIGSLLMYELFDRFSGKEYTEYDLLRGGEHYKNHITNEYRNNMRITIVKNNLITYFKILGVYISKYLSSLKKSKNH
ncbi:MAG: GNAT family N-acetyltransferase [Clostridiales bacterium]